MCSTCGTGAVLSLHVCLRSSNAARAGCTRQWCAYAANVSVRPACARLNLFLLRIEQIRFINRLGARLVAIQGGRQRGGFCSRACVRACPPACISGLFLCSSGFFSTRNEESGNGTLCAADPLAVADPSLLTANNPQCELCVCVTSYWMDGLMALPWPYSVSVFEPFVRV